MAFDLAKLALAVIPIIITIAKEILKMRSPESISEEEAAAIALFDALIAYLAVANK